MDAAPCDGALTDRYPATIDRSGPYGGCGELPLPFEPENRDGKAEWLPQGGCLSATIGKLHASHAWCEMYRCDSGAGEEIETSDLSHVVMFFPDGISGECSWHDSEGTGPLQSLLPNTTLVKAAGEHLSLRIGRARTPFRLLLVGMASHALDLASVEDVSPGDLKRSGDVRVNDVAVRRTLLALLQEIESPGWNSGPYGAALLELLLCQLARSVRRESECGVHSGKGGLPAW